MKLEEKKYNYYKKIIKMPWNIIKWEVGLIESHKVIYFFCPIKFAVFSS